MHFLLFIHQDVMFLLGSVYHTMVRMEGMFWGVFLEDILCLSVFFVFFKGKQCCIRISSCLAAKLSTPVLNFVQRLCLTLSCRQQVNTLQRSEAG